MQEALGAPSLAARASALASLAALAGVAVAGPGHFWLGAGAVAVAVAVAVAAARVHTIATRSTARLVACLLAAALPGGPWQLTMMLALALFLAIERGRPVLDPLAWARGRVPAAPTLVVGGVTPVALVAWLVIMRPDLGDVLENYVPDLPMPLLVVGALGFVIVNAVLEEVLWRGVLQDRLGATFGARAAIVLQAASFGLQHAHGVPRGPTGVAMVFAWALMLGWLRRRAGGMLAPVLAHVVADATIAAIILSLLDRGA